MIVYLPDFNNKSYWVDGTVTLQGSRLASLYQGNYHNALVPSQSQAGLVSYQITPDPLPEKEISEKFDLKYNHDAEPTKLTVHSIFRGYEAENLRRIIHRSGMDSLQDNYLEFYLDSYEEIERIEDISAVDDRKTNTITLVERYHIKNAMQYLEDESDAANATFTFNVFAYAINGDLRLPSDTRRRQPLAQYHPIHVKHQIIMTHADGWLIEDDSYAIKNSHFEYLASNTGKSSNALTLNYELKTLTDTVSVADSRDYIRDLENLLDSPYYAITFTFPRAQLSETSFDKQLGLIGNWFRQNIDQLSAQSSSMENY